MGINLDKPCICQHCGDHMILRVPIWVTPGTEDVDTGNIDWESDSHKCMSNWHCGTCEDNHFPLDNE